MKNFNKNNLIESIREIGVQKGDIIFSHSNIGFFGYPEEGTSKEILFNVILDSFLEVLGDEGTMIVPTFTYSFCKNEVFDVQEASSTSGLFTEMFRQHPLALRSLDPIFSVAAIGKYASHLVDNVAEECFGEGSFWDRFYKSNGKIVNMNMDAGNTFIHYVERMLNVPYRYDKTFTGQIRNNGSLFNTKAIYFVRDMAISDNEPDFTRFDNQFRKQNNFVKSSNIGKGVVLAFNSSDMFSFIKTSIIKDPDLMIKKGRTFN